MLSKDVFMRFVTNYSADHAGRSVLLSPCLIEYASHQREQRMSYYHHSISYNAIGLIWDAMEEEWDQPGTS